MRSTILTWAALALATCVLGCGSVSGGGIGGTGVAQGVISNGATGGALSVGGILFDIRSADITVNGLQADSADLRPGMVATVNGTINDVAGTGVAEEVRVEALLRGPVQSVDVAQGIVTVFGQPLVVTTGTVFEGTTLASLLPGTVVEAGGLTTTGGDVTATRISVVTAPASFVVRGRIEGLDPIGKTFRIRRVLVDFNGASVVTAPPGGLADGQLVRVLSSALIAGRLAADSVEALASEIAVLPGLILRVEGFVTEVVSGNVFVLNDQITVRVNADTAVDNGGARDLQPDTRILVEGKVNSNRRLVALRIEIRTAAGGVPVRR